MEGMALLRDLRTHSMDCSTCKIRFLQPWAHQGLTPKQWQGLETVLHNYVSKFILLMNKVVKDEDENCECISQQSDSRPCDHSSPPREPLSNGDQTDAPGAHRFLPLWLNPFVIQASIGCELHPNGTSRQFCDAAENGEDFISFSVDEGTWVAQRGDKLALSIRDLFNQDKSTTATAQFLLRTTCVSELKSFVQYGKESLARQERPVAVVFARAPPPAGTPAPVLLVCRVTGFYPRPVRVAWLQDGEEVAPGWRLNSSGILPNADLTYQLRSSLAVGPGDGHSYTCRVQHSSLGGQSLLIPWGHSRPWGPGLAVGITLGALAVAAVAVVLWWRIRRGHPDVRAGEPRA
ncbi:T-cell surface glycoprotein CD1b-3-like [Mauremys reevesii]|uniref:T-cell surface glycoprotein CD1b-3-like n=1 Tax=Mauremys reevesii TaxID=260615 RepID=UPI00193F9182|nr:T-cell surface glycoprotein CD1b-3-like [Mauremys reevesii]